MFPSLAKDDSVINAKRWNDRFYDGLLQGGSRSSTSHLASFCVCVDID